MKIANDYDFFNHLTIFLQNNSRHIFISVAQLLGVYIRCLETVS